MHFLFLNTNLIIVLSSCFFVTIIMTPPIYSQGRFDGTPFKRNSAPLTVLGGLIIWVGWYGYITVSTHSVVGNAGALAGVIAANATLSAAFSTVTMIVLQMATNKIDITTIIKATISGLVGISAACSVVEMWGAMLIGIASCLVFVGASTVVEQMKIDDATDAFAVHGANGIWGALAVGIFGSDRGATFAHFVGSAMGNHCFRTGEQFGVQLVGIICIVAWTFGWSALVFFGLKATVGIRVDDATEEKGDTECEILAVSNA
jgi:ammonium transporter, Amt family